MIDVFRESCKTCGYTLRLLAMGEKWQGFAWRWEVLLRALKDLSADCVVLVTDAFDSCVVADSVELLRRFKEFESPIVFSCEPSRTNFMPWAAYYRWRVFGVDPIVNGGTYMGYAGDLREFIARLKYNPDTDDQRLLTSLHRYIRMTVDVESRLFYHQCGGMRSVEIPDTCVVTFPASGYTTTTLKQLGYELPSQDPHNHDCGMFVRRATHYGPFFWREIVTVFVMVCIGIYVYVCR